ncbi:shikimate kinase [Spirochaetia bacterium]|nr:shikimate kinase [Spirochaetia bacterium]
MCALIILTGPKHSGKTTAGKALANRCGGTFIDLDELVQERAGKSPRTLFKAGPGVFRKVETEALQSLINAKADGDAPGQGGHEGGSLRIVAAGGGLVDNSPALALLRNSGAAIHTTGAAIHTTGAVTLVYLEVSVETAWERIRASAEKTGELPPFLNTDDPQETHRLLHERRAVAYREIAGVIVQADGKSPEEIGEELFARVICGSS